MDYSEYKDFKTLAVKARDYHRDHTMPWLWGGTGILPMELFDDYNTYMTDVKIEAEELAKIIVEKYPQRIIDNEKRLAKLHNIIEYPPVSVIAGKFFIGHTYFPVSQMDFRAVEGLSEKQKAECQSEAEQFIRDDLAEATSTLFERFYKYVNRMYERLENEDKTFHDTLISNIIDIAEVLPKLNVTNNPELNKLCEAAMLKLTKYDPRYLRDDLDIRAKVCADAKELSDAAALYFQGPQALKKAA